MIREWLQSCFPKHRLQPTERDVADMQAVFSRVFDNASGHELIEHWMESIVMQNPRSADPNVCVQWAAQCAFVEDIVKALDKARNPNKYQAQPLSKYPKYDARSAVNGPSH